MITVAVLASGSDANCVYVDTGAARFLLDAGLSFRRVKQGLAAIGRDITRLDAVFISHEHTDHTAGLAGIVGALQIPVYATPGTLAAFRSNPKQFQPLLRHAPCLLPLPFGEVARIGNSCVMTMPLDHDAAEPSGFLLALENGWRMALATDLGTVPETLAGLLSDVDFLFLEANHDVDVLREGPYDARMRQRVLRWHLSNDAVTGFVETSMKRVGRMWLGHISSNNNDPRLVYAMTEHSLRSTGHATELRAVTGPASFQVA